MKQYAGQYMQQSGGKQTGQSQSGQSQSGDYRKYMKQYAGQYAGKYMQQSGDQSKSSSSSSQSYQKYMNQYASQSTQGSQGQTNLLATSGSNDDSAGYQKYMNQYTCGNSQSSGGNYQKYMKQYAGKYTGGNSQSSRSNYEKYLKQYGGSEADKYIQQYAGQSNQSSSDFSDYKKYISMYSCDDEHTVESAKKAMNKTQLDAWKDAQLCTVKKYVIDHQGQHYAQQGINKEYTRRLAELRNETAEQASAADASLMLAARDDRNKTQHMSKAEMRQAANVTVQKVEALSQSLELAANDKDGIEAQAALPAQRTQAEFAKNHSEIKQEMENLETQLKKQHGAQDAKAMQSIQSRLSALRTKAKALRTAEMQALKRNTKMADSASRHQAAGAQDAARDAARDARRQTDKLARKYWDSEGDLATKLDDRAEKATDTAEAHSQTLARRTQDALQQHEDNAASAMQEDAETARKAMQSMQDELTQLQQSQHQTGSEKVSLLAESTLPPVAAFLSAAALGSLVTHALFKKWTARREVEKLQGYCMMA